MLKENIFLKEGLSNFMTVGSICPTSRFVAKAMVPIIKPNDLPKIIVELGVGTGNVTKEIVKRLRPIDYFFGVDSNRNLLEVCRNNICSAGNINLEHSNAQNIPELLLRYGIKEVDEVVCTIPFRILPKEDVEEVLLQVNNILKFGGYFKFIRYTFAPENKMIKKVLNNFKVVDKEIIVRNIPPAEVVKMVKMSYGVGVDNDAITDIIVSTSISD